MLTPDDPIHYWTAEEVAALSDEALTQFIYICQDGERVAMAVKNGRAMSRYGYILEHLAYPEQDRRRKAEREWFRQPTS